MLSLSLPTAADLRVVDTKFQNIKSLYSPPPGTTIWDQDLGSDGSDAESVGMFPSYGGLEDCGNDSSSYGGRRVVVAPCGLCSGGWGVSLHHHGASFLTENL